MSKIKKLDKDKLPVYEIVVDEMDETGISLISLVDAPAIEMKGMYFSENKQMTFKEVKDEQMIIGPALIPDMKIYREDTNFGQYYVTFTKDTIAKMVEKFNRTGSNRKINLEHTNEMVNAFIVEDWIVEDKVYDKSRKYGFEVPIGTYMIKVKVDDEKFWHEQVKDNGKFGFSIEGILGQKLISLKSEYEKQRMERVLSAFSENNLEEMLEELDQNEFEIFVKEVLGLLDDENLNEVAFNKITNLFGLK